MKQQAMTGEFLTRNLYVASYILAIGGPMPTAKDQDEGPISFAFEDPTGEWKRLAAEFNLQDTDSEVCLVPAARLFEALRILRDLMHAKTGLRTVRGRGVR
jgi:hypothetical protein